MKIQKTKGRDKKKKKSKYVDREDFTWLHFRNISKEEKKRIRNKVRNKHGL